MLLRKKRPSEKKSMCPVQTNAQRGEEGFEVGDVSKKTGSRLEKRRKCKEIGHFHSRHEGIIKNMKGGVVLGGGRKKSWGRIEKEKRETPQTKKKKQTPPPNQKKKMRNLGGIRERGELSVKLEEKKRKNALVREGGRHNVLAKKATKNIFPLGRAMSSEKKAFEEGRVICILEGRMGGLCKSGL